VLSHNKS